jgi:hypothetical protein
MESIWDATRKSRVVLEKLFHLLAISSKDEDHPPSQVFNFGEQKVEHNFPTGVMAFCELVCFIDEIYAAFSVLEFLQVLFDLGDSTVRET